MTDRFLHSMAGLLALLCACSSDGNSGGTGSSPSCEPVTFSMLNVANTEAKVCSAATQCMADKCAATVDECAGPDFKSGVYAGTCASYFDCVKGCKCEKACADQCAPDTTDCALCLSSKLAMGCTMKCMTEIGSCGKK